ncbi:hypothetical protein E2K98_30380 [Bacillus salipaludis]|uniref:Uncharacterized protein n=1 Tax=Bacillus salipaludis TaxID=2547811 RepID=A0A4R5VGV1_9BACI|nr:hypothetical protein [Bacillus salipaludis]MDQ6598965.1 hypothetical protein [Bacillus salipaludis]TDK52971.1 hypothetical protein E2K98_30380 [Bacillus salipaludis]
MKVKSSLIAPVIAASLLAPAVGTVIAHPTTDSAKTAVSVQKEHHKKWHHKWEKGEKKKELTNVINKYATPQLKTQLTKDMATRQSLLKQLRQTPGFKKDEAKEKQKKQEFYKAHKKEIDSIKQQLKDGKLTKQQARSKFEALFGKEREHFKGKEENEKGVYKQLKTAIKDKNKKEINAALKKFDQELEKSIKELQKEIKADK